MAEIRVDRLTGGDAAAAAAWDRFVAGRPEATFFHRAGWRAVVERAFGHACYFLQASRDGACGGPKGPFWPPSRVT